LPGNNLHTTLTDEQLLSQFQASGNNELLGVLLQRYTALLFGVALKYLKDRTRAEDAVQQIFLKVLSNAPREEIHNFKGWLYILMRNHCLQELRDKTFSTENSVFFNLEATETNKEDMLLQESTLQQMNEAIETLNEEQRRSIVLFYFKKYSYEQIIAETGFTFMQVKSYIQNGKRNLKTILVKKLANRQK